MKKKAKLDPPEPPVKGKNIHKVIIRPPVGIAFEIDFGATRRPRATPTKL
jgi:hypothetical protein